MRGERRRREEWGECVRMCECDVRVGPALAVPEQLWEGCVCVRVMEEEEREWV